MAALINDDFLLKNDISKKLYHYYAEDMPIFDYHCHISAKDIADNRQYESITELWLEGDHYKWRAMRANGIEEKYITGNAHPEEKFRMWAYTMEYLVGNPLFHWTQLELKRYFDIDDILCRENQKYIYDKINEMLKDERFRCRNIISGSNVKALCTTDDPLDMLEYHRRISDSGFETLVSPTFRPDRLYYVEREPFIGYIKDIGKKYNIEMLEFSMILEFLETRIEYFHSVGCRIADHSLEPPVYECYSYSEVCKIFKKRMDGNALTEKEVNKYKTAIIDFAGHQYTSRDWVMQIHIGVRRNINSNMFKLLGPDTGFDCISDICYMTGLTGILDMLEKDNSLPRTVIYCLDPGDNEMIASAAGCFQKAPIPGKIQFGSAWWFNDTKDGMQRQLLALAGIGLLSRFIGMLTDSRSILSYKRHEYFRRILCEILGKWAMDGDIPKDEKLLGRIVQDISFNNAREYFNLSMKKY